MTIRPGPPPASDAAPATIAFTSRYGSTARYARTLAARLHTEAVDLADLRSAAGPLVVLAPIHVSRAHRQRAVIAALRSATGPVAVGLVGMSTVDDDERLAATGRLRAAVTDPAALEVFQLRGAYDPARLGLIDRLMMWFAARRMPESDDPAARAIRARRAVDLTDDVALDPIERWARGESG